MLSANDLILGQCYFLLIFHHPKEAIPVIKTYIYMGKNLYKNKEVPSVNDWFFQDSKSYLRHGSFLELPDKIEREVFIAEDDILSRMYDIDGLIDALQKLKEGKL